MKTIKQSLATQFINNLFNLLTYKKQIGTQSVETKTLFVHVELNNGEHKVIKFDDYFRINNSSGVMELQKTALKSFQRAQENKHHVVMIKNNKEDKDFKTISSGDIKEFISTETVITKQTYQVYSLNFFGLLFSYESKQIS